MPTAAAWPDARRRAGCAVAALWVVALLAGCAAKPQASRQSAKPGLPPGPARPAPGALRLSADLRESLLARTLMVVNTPYSSGGNTPQGGFDCSGLVQWAVGGITRQKLPRTTQQWAQASRAVARRNLCRGDFVFFNTTGKAHSHMGIFAGNGHFVHAPSRGGTVRRVPLDNPWFATRFTEARSIFRA